MESGFLDLVYDVAFDPAGWVPLLEQFADMMGGHFAALVVQDQVSGVGRSREVRDDPDRKALYFQHFASRNPLLRITDLPARPRVFTDEEKMPRHDLERSEYYHDYLKKYDMHSLLIVRLAVSDSNTVVINVARSRRQELFDTAEIKAATMLLPHLVRAVRLGTRFAALQDFNFGMRASVDGSHHATFVVGANGSVRYLNPAAEALLARRHGLSLRNGALGAASEQLTRRLHALIARAIARNGERTNGAMALPRPGHGLPLSVLVSPVGPERLSAFSEGACALISIRDPDSAVPVSEQRVRDVFGLTRAETRVALKLLEGRDTRETAKALGVSFYTVRAHLARIFDKTGTQRQAELVALLTRLLDHLLETS